jgi:hypothetical protein
MKIHEIVARLRRMNAHEGIMFLQAEIRKERLHSVRRNELTSLLQGKMTKQLRKETRVA